MNAALQVASLLAELFLSYTEVAAKAKELIDRARAEGRDISDAELAALKADRKAAVKAWRDA